MSLDSSSYLNRELSWLEFNHRVLEEAQDPTQPLLERLKFLTIVSSNLDEFFEIRVAALKQLVENRSDVHGPDGLRPPDVLAAIRTRVLRMVADQYQLLHETLLPALAHEGLHLRAIPELNDIQIEWARQIFQRDILPILTPLAVDPSHPFPQLLNKSVNLVVLFSKPGYQESTRHAFVQIPRGISRLIALPKDGGNPREFILLSELIRHFVSEVFPRMKIYGAWPTRITRNSELYIDEEEAHNLLLTIEEELQKRNRGAAVRLELTQDCPVEIETYLLGHLHLSHEDVYRVTGPVNLTQLFSLTESGRGLPNLHDPLFTPSIPPPLALPARTFDAIRQNDILLHHPYESFQPIISLLEQAAIDPQVLAIKMTLYRTSKDSPVVAALIRAAENSKQVMALVELKARFDEDNNIQWAKQLEASGVHVVYGVLGLKTHTKILLVVRKEKERLNSYVHIGTGNYNSKTSSLYTDIGLLTARPEFGADLVELFNYLTGFSKQQSFRRLLVAPVTLRSRMEDLIRREIDHAQAGRGGRIRAKMNALVDPAIIALLYEASQAGVMIELVVRGMCSLRPQLEGISDNIQVVSVIGRFLEHSRLFWFGNGGEPELFFGSADWMSRNLDRRVEAVAPIEDPKLRHQLEQAIDLYLNDTSAWHMDNQGKFSQRQLEGEQHLVQREMMRRWRGGLVA